MYNPVATNKVIVGISGGVDSAVAALLLKQQGYQVEAMFMKNWEQDDRDQHCAAEQDLADARAVCAHLQIPIHTVNFSQTYWDKVFHYFLQEYQAGRTPNPDIICNKEIKFTVFLQHALKLGANYIATGHYAQCIQQNDQYILAKGFDDTKDQSYFLHTLNQTQLSKVLFPLGDLLKKQVRTLAEKNGFINHDKKDSTGICFIGERKFKNFLNEYLLAKPGDIEDPDGNVLGKHDGLMFHTIGQRKGLQIGGRKNTSNAPWYVVKKNCLRNVLTVAQGTEHPLLYSKKLVCRNIHLIAGDKPNFPLHCHAKTRYRQKETACVVNHIQDQKQQNDYYQILFTDKQRAITPGQSVVFYQNDLCLGGGIIEDE